MQELENIFKPELRYIVNNKIKIIWFAGVVLLFLQGIYKIVLHSVKQSSDGLLTVLTLLSLLICSKLSSCTLLTHGHSLQVPVSGTTTANPYVKVYLLPDPYKSTKRKTKVAKRTLHPTYNETVSYCIIWGSSQHVHFRNLKNSVLAAWLSEFVSE